MDAGDRAGLISVKKGLLRHPAVVGVGAGPSRCWCIDSLERQLQAEVPCSELDRGDCNGADPDPDQELKADVTRDLQEFRALEAAREHIKEGEYGVCIECGSDVAYERLKAFPAALRCIECQQRHEKTYGGEPKPTL